MIDAKTIPSYGILCDSLHFQTWQAEIIHHLAAEGIEPVLIVMPAEAPIANITFTNKLWHYPYKNLVFRLFYRFLLKPDVKRPIDLSAELNAKYILNCKTYKKGIADYFEAKDIEKIRKSGAAFLLRFGFGIIRGPILEATPYGIWSFHHDDPEVVRGVPSNFWEILEGIPVNGAILQRLTEKIDAGIILRQGWFKTINHSWKANVDQAYRGTTEWPLQVCRDIVNGCAEYFDSPVSIKPSKMRFAPGNLTMIKFIMRLIYNKLKFHLDELLYTERWVTGVCGSPYNNVLLGSIPFSDAHLMKGNNSNHYKADPHGFSSNGKHYIMYEDYSYTDRHGKIMFQALDGTFKPEGKPKSAIEKPYHLAFPFVFEHNNSIYCIPENSEGHSVDLYEFDPKDSSFIFRHTLISNLQAVDPVIFHHEQRWWLLFTDKKATNTLLNIWYCDELTGVWQPHKNNPVKTDIRSSRPAGPVSRIEGRLIRPTQDCSKFSGWRIAVQEILEITPETFSEKTVHYIEPGAESLHADGIHTLSGNAEFSVFDMKKHTFIFRSFLYQLKRKLRLL